MSIPLAPCPRCGVRVHQGFCNDCWYVEPELCRAWGVAS